MLNHREGRRLRDGSQRSGLLRWNDLGVEALNNNEQFEKAEGLIRESGVRWDDNPRAGTVVHVTANRPLMMARRYASGVGKAYSYRLAPNAKVTCDGMLCNLQDLTPGQRVRVTAMGAGDWSMAIRIEALDEQWTFSVATARAR
jgi:hypothetical protein